jgi:Rieske Fe-S protein
LGISTHLGCRLVTRGDPTFGDGFASSRDMAPFEDPCGGSTYALNGDCVGGPCPRGLDRYHVQITDGTARIDLEQLVPGPARYAQ